MSYSQKIVSVFFFSAVFVLTMTSCDTKEMTKKVMYNRARNLHDHGKIDEAIEVYKRVLSLEGDNTEVHYDLGVAYADKEDLSRAREQAQYLREHDRRDLAEVLSTVIHDANSPSVRKKHQDENQ